MVETMEAIVCNDFNEWSIEDVPRPEPKPQEVVIDVSHVQLSITECQRFSGEGIFGREKIHNQMQNGNGRVFGHEFSGIVTEVGDNVPDLNVGDRVYPPGVIYCGECAYCESGYQELCVDQTRIGKGRAGALAEYVAVPSDILRKMPDEVSYSEGAAMQPLASSVLYMNDAEIKTGDVVVIMGAGVMGNQCGQLAFMEGASKVYAVDIDADKLEIAADQDMVPIDSRNKNPSTFIHEETNGIGADVVISTVGGQQSHMTSGNDPLSQAYNSVRSDGKIVQVGHVFGEISLSPKCLRNKSVDWINPRKGMISLGPNTDTGKFAAKLVAENKINIGNYISHELAGLSSFGDAVKITRNKKEYNALGPAQIIVNS